MATESYSLELSDIRTQLSAHSSNCDEQFKLLELVSNMNNSALTRLEKHYVEMDEVNNVILDKLDLLDKKLKNLTTLVGDLRYKTSMNTLIVAMIGASFGVVVGMLKK